ncbi:hypothetical protein [Thermomonas sp.]|uniref:hypothetical protein n=1 Tax=Thermomonas sp. TaxID=1971895 RepID=UPI0024877105|nr:hypothetical protein [Thermomonas sp.]MDI1253192.1 hypothetical protein [Thermomonas sp.]
MKIHFTDFFNVDKRNLEEYGAYNISLINDLPLFVDPFLIFNSEDATYRQLHSEIIQYVTFLRDEAKARLIDKGLMKAWYCFPEVRQNWLGYSKNGNSGSGLGEKFALALHESLGTIFNEFGKEKITKGSHLEKLCLIKDGVGKDNISDFTVNLIKGYLCDYTQSFAAAHLEKSLTRELPVEHASFNYKTGSWETRRYRLPYLFGDYVLLTPKNILTKDEAWINKSDLIHDFEDIATALPNDQLRAQVDRYLQSQLPKDPNRREVNRAVSATLRQFPQMIDYYIRHKEDRGDQARSISDQRVDEASQAFELGVRKLSSLLQEVGFYGVAESSHEAAHRRVAYLKKVIEDNDGYRVFYIKGKPIQRESDLHVMYRLTWFASEHDVNSEVNNGRGPVDYKISHGRHDSSLVEFKLASNSKLKQNLKNQVEIYKKASETDRAIKVILCFNEAEQLKLSTILNELKLTGNRDIIVIDASRDNKPSGSNAK